MSLFQELGQLTGHMTKRAAQPGGSHQIPEAVDGGDRVHPQSIRDGLYRPPWHSSRGWVPKALGPTLTSIIGGQSDNLGDWISGSDPGLPRDWRQLWKPALNHFGDTAVHDFYEDVVDDDLPLGSNFAARGAQQAFGRDNARDLRSVGKVLGRREYIPATAKMLARAVSNLVGGDR